jgi:hypothetical protein
MGDDKGNVWLVPPPPPAVLRAMNILARPLIRSPLGKRLGGVMLLEFRGRRSGRAMAVPVNFHLVDSVPMATTKAAWRHNFSGGAPATVTHRGVVYQTTGTLTPVDAQEMGVAIRKSMDTGGSAQRMGIRTAGDHDPTAAELAALSPGLGTSLITFDFRPSLPRD